MEPAVPRPFKELKTNVFEMAPLNWKLEDSQKGWSPEDKKGSMAWEGGRRDTVIADSQMEEGITIETVSDKEGLRRRMI